MPIAGISQGLGLGGGATATISGSPGGGATGGFNIDVRDTQANILVRTGDATGVIAYGTDTEDLYVYDGTNWQIYNNS
jgi:hypothetical protein